eukprot:TRINITY_DN2572_c0_g1_i2.p1 TRINITY_DN2572_c0_g1~~TRINITY_DN2572_c0_g1_i2.p1  ORF type:complete len:328 (+),score=44.58 TRINITY_DN2572_c0_g1_i2:47-1030(+)
MSARAAARDCARAPAPRRRDEPAPTKLRRLAAEDVINVDEQQQQQQQPELPDSPPLWFRLTDNTDGRTSPIGGPLAPRQSSSSSASPLLFSPSTEDPMCTEEGGPPETEVEVPRSPQLPAERPVAQAGPCVLCMRPLPSASRPFGCIQRATREFERLGTGTHLDEEQWNTLSQIQSEIYAHCHKLAVQVAKADATGEWSSCPLKAAERRWRSLQDCLARIEGCLDAMHHEAHSRDPLQDAPLLPFFRERYRLHMDYAAQARAHLLHHVLPAARTDSEQRAVFCELFGPERGRSACREWQDTMQLRSLVANCEAAFSALDGQMRSYRL